MKRLAIHKNLIALLLVIFAVVVLHTLQSFNKKDQVKHVNEIMATHNLFSN